MSSRGYSKSELRNLLNNLDDSKISAIPYDNPHTVADRARKARIQLLNGMGLLKWNIESEAKILFLDNNPKLINSATKFVWDSKLTHPQRQEFENLAKNANMINRNIRQSIEDTHNRVSQMDSPQVGNNPLENDFYNGTKFGNNGFEFLLPIGSLGNSGWLDDGGTGL
ncbi:6920_t:CDS:1 [Funneliformis geosporum]|uniref:6856_t:CDS:1 n=1 Tax=Funneliformis geosporum TaxID=1117311 RepID=A0A9W4SCP7_9GLOM|nr:6920_t:CDS:1 [Funneliformis geosporum]CAI2163557.1 6856_t:CDS:1 [Funneliformis geosporum]